jgi:cyclase
LAASIFHYGKYSVKEAKEYLDSKGIPVRIWDVKYPWEPI